MSITSRFIFGVALTLVLLACSVNAHGWMSYPSPRGQYTTPPKPAYQEYAPAAFDPTDKNIICRGDPEMPKAKWLPLQAGQSQKITLQFNARHVGDCFVYLTYDGDKPLTEMKWFKIWEQHECKNSNDYEIEIPSYLPSGEHVIFRWEWYALHVYPIVEYYSQCVDATITASATARAQGLPTPQVTMPGHMPKFAGDYADRTNNYWWPWDDQPMFFTGPKLASLGGQSTPATAAPNRPATAAPATQKPATPATQPPYTAPTTAPSTPKPAATSKPSSTTPTRPPVNQPAAQSVKLNVLNTASTWWFAASVSGHRSSEVAKMEIMDSGSFKDFTPMRIGWSDVWTFEPGTRGPLVFPITVRASLASGTSLSFAVNSLPATVIDSGAVFA